MVYVEPMLSRTVDGSQVRAAREERGLSVKAVAAAVGCSPSHIYRIEQGRVQPGAGLYHSLCRILGTEHADLLAPAGEAA